MDHFDGESAIFKATSRGLMNFLELLLENGASVNVVNRVEKSPVHLVRSIEALKLLLQYGSDINKRNNLGNTLLHYIYGWSQLINQVEWIINQGASIDIKNNKGFTPARVALRKAHYAQDFKLAYQFFSLVADKKSVDSNGISSLSYLVSKVSSQGKKKEDPATQMAVWLVKNNADLNLQTNTGHSILHDAIRINSDEHTLLTEILNSNGLNLNIVNGNGENALLAVLNSNVVKNQIEIESILKVIKAGIDLNLQNKDGDTALMLNFKFGGDRYTEITKLIVSKGANLNLRNNSGKTALGLAKDRRLISDTIRLLVDSGATE